ncbi:hypothetical protein [Microlunatus speluncae]|uniref:hypothetical protein n=1 Tax=Microlunatus speluncae TaxID=2594267 RepID=UPI0012665727|nr:hypothetical protein [Microlunatus speluncae]
MLRIRGISYLLDDVSTDRLRQDLPIIRDELHCTAVMIIGGDPDQLADAAAAVIDAGLDVWIRPHLLDRPWSDLLDQLRRVGRAAERLRQRFPDRVTLLVGSEFSHTARGIVPGSWSYLRLRIILRAHRLLRRRIDRRLDQLLDRAAVTARDVFSGPVSYAAASWEEVDWTRFDAVGVSLYRSGTDDEAYARRVAALVRDHDRPVIITEFGCGAFAGAERRGPGSFRIVNWFTDPPVIRDDHPRDEETQARYLGELIDLFAETGVAGCFVFTYAMRGFPRRDDPRVDLDKAGFGIVAVPEDGEPRPKAAFHQVARQYGELGRDRPEAGSDA